MRLFTRNRRISCKYKGGKIDAYNIYTLILRYHPSRVIVWHGKETVYDGTRGDLFEYVGWDVEWLGYEYFEETGELLINV